MNTLSSKLRDGDLPLEERIRIALRRATNGEATMRVPAEATDPDIVLSDCLDALVEIKAELATLKTLRPRAEHDGRTLVHVWQKVNHWFGGSHWHFAYSSQTVPYGHCWTPIPKPQEPTP